MKDFGRKICLMEKVLYIKMELFKTKLKFKLIIKIFLIQRIFGISLKDFLLRIKRKDKEPIIFAMEKNLLAFLKTICLMDKEFSKKAIFKI